MTLPELQLPDMPLLSLVLFFILFFVLELTSRKDARTSEQPLINSHYNWLGRPDSTLLFKNKCYLHLNPVLGYIALSID